MMDEGWGSVIRLRLTPALLDFGGRSLVCGSCFLFWAGANGAPSSGTSRAATYTWSRELKFRHLADRIFWESL